MLINENNPHGGQIYKGEARKIRADFSVNVNPQGAPREVIEAAKAAIDFSERYPDAECTELREAVALKEDVDKDHIICGNGGAEIIFQLAAALRPKKILVTEPTFCEYRQSAEAFGGEAASVVMKESFDINAETDRILSELDKDKDIEIVFLCNPNNPTGRVMKRENVKRLLEGCENSGVLLAVDESFGELTENYRDFSVVGMTKTSKSLFVIKSMTKTYAIPGIRVGYGICRDKELLEKLCRSVQCWNLSAAAQKAGTAAAGSCRGYVEKTLDIIRKERSFLAGELVSLGITVFESETNYMLIKAGTNLKEQLFKRGILIRACGNFIGLGKNYFRIAVKSHDENVMLIETLREMKKEGALCTEQA